MTGRSARETYFCLARCECRASCSVQVSTFGYHLFKYPFSSFFLALSTLQPFVALADVRTSGNFQASKPEGLFEFLQSHVMTFAMMLWLSRLYMRTCSNRRLSHCGLAESRPFQTLFHLWNNMSYCQPVHSFLSRRSCSLELAYFKDLSLSFAFSPVAYKDTDSTAVND